MSIPLATKKALKESIPKVEELVAKAGGALGVTLTFDDNTADLFAALDAPVKGGRKGAELPKGLEVHAAWFPKLFEAFAEDPSRKEALTQILDGCGGKVGFTAHPTDPPPAHYDWSGGVFRIVVWIGYWGNDGHYPSKFSPDQLEKLIKVPYQGIDSLPLAVKKALVAKEPLIVGHMSRASTALGKEVTWDVDYADLFANCSKYRNFAISGLTPEWANIIEGYAKQVGDVFTTFCANADNKEALADAMSTGKVGFWFMGSDYQDKPWKMDTGRLGIGVAWNDFNKTSRIPGANAAALEKIL